MTREEQIAVAFDDYSDARKLCTFDDFEYADIQVAFEAGAQWADEHPISSWISVKEKLPYNNPIFIHFGFTNRVLVRSKKGNLFIAYMKKNEDNKWIWCNDVDDNFDLLSYITHWMYIPKIEKD